MLFFLNRLSNLVFLRTTVPKLYKKFDWDYLIQANTGPAIYTLPQYRVTHIFFHVFFHFLLHVIFFFIFLDNL